MAVEAENLRNNSAIDLTDLTPIEKPFKILVDGKPTDFILTEASADAAVKWRNEVARCTKMAGGHVSSVEGMAGSDPYLISMCLYATKPDGSRGILVTSKFVLEKFTNKVMKKLVEVIHAISDLKADNLTLEQKIEKAEKELRIMRKDKEEADNAKNA